MLRGACARVKRPGIDQRMVDCPSKSGACAIDMVLCQALLSIHHLASSEKLSPRQDCQNIQAQKLGLGLEVG